MTTNSDAVGVSAFRGPLLHFLSEPGLGTPDPASYSYFTDGLLVTPPSCCRPCPQAPRSSIRRRG